jgi:hypothetical protein
MIESFGQNLFRISSRVTIAPSRSISRRSK